ncbi:unnamed protein product [Heterobilharzia americana]|nr:unnamed protein product [Heterobilharzia americana]CAH8524316.1 unnamed protein product [Heterobilharzia americana]
MKFVIHYSLILLLSLKCLPDKIVRRLIAVFLLIVCTVLLIKNRHPILYLESSKTTALIQTNEYGIRNNDKNDPRHLPLIFIGGHQSSGTGLLRILMDIHPAVRCGPEPVVTREILLYRSTKIPSMDWLSRSGISQDVLDNAVAGFIVSILQNMGPPAERLCHKDPGSSVFLKDLSVLFPKAKFIHMVRDGRAAVASTVARRRMEEIRL